MAQDVDSPDNSDGFRLTIAENSCNWRRKSARPCNRFTGGAADSYILCFCGALGSYLAINFDL